MHIIVYTKAGCPWCKEVLDFLIEKEIPYEEREVRNNKTNFDEMVRISGQTKSPTIDVDGEVFADSDRDELEAYLKGIGAIK